MAAKHASLARWLRTDVFRELASFVEFESRVNKIAEEKDRGDVFEIFIEGYLATQSIAQCNQHWIVGSIPLSLRERYRLPSDGTGIDGIYEATDGTHVAYQVKYRQKSHLTYQEVAPFLGLTERFTDRVILTNAETLSSHALPRTRWVRRQDFLALSPEALGEITSWIRGAPVERKRASPDPRYQTQALADIQECLQKNSRTTVVMACGTGKTLLSLWAVEQYQPRTALVLLPSLSLVQQTVREWARHNGWGRRFSFICVCSDPTVAKSEDLPELCVSDVGFRVDTDPSIVRGFLTSRNDSVRVVFSTYQSSSVVAEAMSGLPAFDIAIFDEAHKTTGLAGGLFGRALSDSHIPIQKRVFLTATPRHIDIRSKRDKDGEYRVQSMDDPSIYGPTAHTLSFKAAADNGIICPYQVVISVVDKDLVSDFARKNGITLVEGDEVGARWVSNLVALSQAIKQTGARKVISFHSRVALAREFASDSPRGISRYVEGFEVRHVNGAQPSANRAELLRAFAEADKGIITNARCLTEGVDIPAVDMVAFIDPRQSRVDIAQAVGRAMRKPRGGSEKTVGYVFVPLFLDADRESIDECLRDEKFETIADVLNALQEHDEELVDLISEARQGEGEGAPFKPRLTIEKVRIIGPQVELERLTKSIETKLIDALGTSWDEWFGLLVRWRSERGREVPGVEEEYRGVKLGVWVATQRALYQKQKLHEVRLRKLERLPGWFWDHEEWLWRRGLDAARDFSAAHGHLSIPRGYVHSSGVRLDHWIRSAKQRYAKNALTEDQAVEVAALQGWHWQKFEEVWWLKFDQLRLEIESGKRLADLESDRSRSGLAGWIFAQRSRYASMHGKNRAERKPLSPEQIDALFSLRDWSWNRRGDSWQQHFEAAVEYKNEHGELPPASDRTTLTRYKGLLVASWLGKEKSRLASRTPEQIKLLKQHLPELFTGKPIARGSFADRWNSNYQTLVDWCAKFGSAEVPQNAVFNDVQLGKWVAKQRQRYKTKRITAEQIQLLNECRDWIWDASALSASAISKTGVSPAKRKLKADR
jgi:superfamily II DNA or RNA helicase